MYYWMKPFWNYGNYLGFCQKAISQSFEELQSRNLEYKLITPKYFTSTYFGDMVAILDFYDLGVDP